MKDKFFKICTIVLILGFVGCKNNSDDENNKLDSKEIFINDVNEIKNMIETVPNKDEYQNDYNTYYLQKDYLYGYNYNTTRLEYNYDIVINYDYEFKSGVIIKNKDNEMYLSIENKDYCAIKDFKDNDISVYDILEKDKCHITHIMDENLSLGIFSKYLDNDELYSSGEVADRTVSLSAFHNILDDGNCTYTWYRNGEKIEDSNVKTYVVTSDYEDADYYVEMTTYEGQTIKSEHINVKISRKLED